MINTGGKWADIEKLKNEHPNYNFYKFEQKDFNKAPEHIKKHTNSIKGFPTVLIVDKNGTSKEIDRNLNNL